MVLMQLTIFVMFNIFILIFSFCAIIDVSMPLFTGHTLNLTSKLFQRLGLKKLANLFKLKLKKSDD